MNPHRRWQSVLRLLRAATTLGQVRRTEQVPLIDSILKRRLCAAAAEHASLSTSWVPLLGFAAAAAVCFPNTASAGNELLQPGSLAALGRDIVHGSLPAKQRALTLLGDLTIFIEHHEVMVRSGLVELLSQALVARGNSPEVQSGVLSCLADLAKSGSAQGRLLGQGIAPAVLRCAVDALQGSGGWQGTPGSRCHAARLLSELCSLPESRSQVVQLGVLGSIIQCSKELPVASGKVVGGGGEKGEHLRREEERYLASALFGAAGSPEGARALREDEATLGTLRRWALCSDPILQRCGVGALAKIAQSGDAEAAGALAASGGVAALVAGLANSDPQAACFAAAGVSSLARQGGTGAEALAQQPGLVSALLEMAQAPNQAALPAPKRTQQGAQTSGPQALQRGGSMGEEKVAQQRHAVGGWSPGVALGVQRCGLRALLACCQAGHPQLLGVMMDGGTAGKAVRDLAAAPKTKADALGLCRKIMDVLEG